MCGEEIQRERKGLKFMGVEGEGKIEGHRRVEKEREGEGGGWVIDRQSG